VSVCELCLAFVLTFAVQFAHHLSCFHRHSGGDAGSPDARRDIVVFIVGGCTYEEAAAVAAFNASSANTHVVLGGSCIHNATTFVDDIIGADER
jgi:hypothetical protein